MTRASSLLIFCVALVCVNGHMSIYIPSMWGGTVYDSGTDPRNSNWAVQPLQDYNFVDWWMHGSKSLNDPPAANAITQLPAGGFYDFEITGNRRFTSLEDGLWVKPGSTNRSVPSPWSSDMGGYGSANLHAPTRESVAACAIGIAYKSDITTVLPNDFVIISVAKDCIARQLQTFDIPALPACPNGKCICSWFWIHNSVGGTDQMYMTPFQCNIQNPTTYTIGTPSAPVRCDNQPICYLDASRGTRTATCAKVLNPMYWANNQGNNMLNPTNFQCAPIYNSSYGFPDGAQNQIFTNRPAQPTGSRGDTLFSTDSIQSYLSPSSTATVLVSPAFRTILNVQADGNVVLRDYPNGTIRWSTNTARTGTTQYRFVVQGDGNLVLYNSTNSPLWNSQTAGQGVGPYRLKLRDNKTLVLVDSNSTPLWKATTN